MIKKNAQKNVHPCTFFCASKKVFSASYRRVVAPVDDMHPPGAGYEVATCSFYRKVQASVANMVLRNARRKKNIPRF